MCMLLTLSLSLFSLLFLISFKFSFLEFHLTDDQVFFFFFCFFSSFSSLFLTDRVVFVLLFLYSQVIELTPYLLNSKMNSILCVDCSKKTIYIEYSTAPAAISALCVLCTIYIFLRLLSSNMIQSLTKLMKTFHKPKINIQTLNLLTAKINSIHFGFV